MNKDDFFEQLGEAGKLKHGVLDQYLPAWLRILGKNLPSGEGRTMHYIDTHAGPGRYKVDQAPGSPVLAIQAAARVLDTYPDLRFAVHLIEADPEHVAALKQEIAGLDIDRDRVQITVWPGDFAEQLPKVLEQIPYEEALFVFIDPFGYDVPMSLVRKALAGRRYAEVFLTLMSDFMARFASDPTKADTLTAVVGSDAWKSFLKEKGVERKMIELYCRNLVADPPGERASRNKRIAFPIEINPTFAKGLYSMIHVSHSPKAREVMERATKAVFGTPAQLLLSHPRDTATVLDALRGMHGTVDVLDLAANVWRLDPFLLWDPHIRKALGELHETGAIEVYRLSTSKGSKSYVPREAGKTLTLSDRVKLTG